MEELLFKSKAGFTPSNFDFGHSILQIKGLENDIIIEFLGTYYMELPRLFKGIEIIKLNDQEVKKILKLRKSLDKNKMNFMKIISNEEIYYIGAISLQIKNRCVR